MNATDVRFATSASELRRAFDRSFAEVQRTGTIPQDDLLAVRLGADPYAIRLSDIAGLFADKQITRLPSRVPALIGIAGFRGVILPVYDLTLLLGYSSTALSRWLVIAAGVPVALAFDAFDGHLRLSRDAIAPAESGTDLSRTHVREVARTSGGVRAIVHIPSVLDAIKKQVPQDAVWKER